MTPDEIKTWIEEKASEQEIYPHKHKDRSAYDTRMLYEINDERYDAAEKCATALYTLLSGELEKKNKEIDYWKARCEAAEDLIPPFGLNIVALREWQELKSKTSNP